jgi:hypothetical protein
MWRPCRASPVMTRNKSIYMDREEFLVELPDGVQVLEIWSSLGDTGGI